MKEGAGTYFYDLDIRDYNLWISEKVPVVLVFYAAVERKAYWQEIGRYFFDDETRRPAGRAKSVRVAIPTGQGMDRTAIAELRRRKNEAE